MTTMHHSAHSQGLPLNSLLPVVESYTYARLNLRIFARVQASVGPGFFFLSDWPEANYI